jgi:long-chain acyl-CoA synthetase
VRTSAAAEQRIDPDAIADRTTVGVFFRQAAKYGDRDLVHYRVDNRPWQTHSWNRMRQDVLAVASALIDAGIEAGDRVVLISENRIEWLFCDFGIQAAGAVTIPIYPNSPPEMVRKIVENSEAKFAIASDTDTAAKLPAGGTLKTIALMDREVHDWVGREPSSVAPIDQRLKGIHPDDLCTIVYTSGTTGDPKGVELAHRNLVDISRSALEVHPITEQDQSLSWLPYAHVFGRINEVFVGIVYGGQTWISRGVEHLAEDIREVKPTIMCSTPRVYEKMHAAVLARVRGMSSTRRAVFAWAIDVGTRFSQAQRPGPWLRARRALADRLVLKGVRDLLTGGRLRFFISGGAALSKDVEGFFWALGVPILNGWGLTETSSGAASNTLHVHRFLTVGKALPGVELKIAGDGEVLVKGPGNMLGYHKNSAATEEMLKDGWIYTGDIGELDADGFLKITDRKKSLFKTSGGKYIAPLPLEHSLLGNPLVERAVVVGDARPFVTALIVPNWEAAKKQGLDEAAVRESVQRTVDETNARLGSWETIKYFTLLHHDFTEEGGELSLKLDIKRKAVATKYADEIEAMYARNPKAS